MNFLPVFFGGLGAIALLGVASSIWLGFRASLRGVVVVMHVWVAAATLALWLEPDRDIGGLWAAAYAGLLAAPLAGAGIAIALYHAVMAPVFLWTALAPFVPAAVWISMMLGAAWLGWRGATSFEHRKRNMRLAAFLSLPMLPSAFSFFSVLGIVGIAPSLLFLASDSDD